MTTDFGIRASTDVFFVWCKQRKCDAGYRFNVVFLAVIYSTGSVVLSSSGQNRWRILFILLLAMLISYPILFAFARGHIYSLLHVVFLSASCYFLLVERKYLLAAFFLAAAVNIRPNALIMIAALPFGTAKVQFKYVGQR